MMNRQKEICDLSSEFRLLRQWCSFL